MEKCIIEWEIYMSTQKPYKIKTEYDFDKYFNLDYKLIRDELPIIGKDVVGYDIEGNQYNCYRSKSFSNDLIIWKNSITTEQIDVNIVLWKYEEILWV